jgi:formylglycine-generating enzyme required for sulfatase activity
MYGKGKGDELNYEMCMRLQAMDMSILAIGLCVGGAFAQEQTESGSRWVLVGDPGNRNPEEGELFWPFGPPRGAVSYEYRMAKHEVTLGEYLEFAIAYAPIYFENHPDDYIAEIAFSGAYLLIDRSQVALRGTNYDRAANMGWEYLARYVNWLHHGKVIEEWAFESGVYDISTFVPQDGEEWEPQPTHAQEARYWIPTQSEWTKAAYWDPNKISDGVGGYWRYPNGTDIALLPDLLPSDGGQRNAGEDRGIFPLSVGSYSNEPSPWGVLDFAGGESEWTEKLIPAIAQFHVRGFMGSEWRSTFYNVPFSEYEFDLDRLGTPFNSGVSSFFGARIATAPEISVDMNSDGRVNFFDISIFLRQFFDSDVRADFRRDGKFDLDDVRVFLGLIANSA